MLLLVQTIGCRVDNKALIVPPTRLLRFPIEGRHECTNILLGHLQVHPLSGVATLPGMLTMIGFG